MTTVLNAYSVAYPSLTNRLMASVYLQSSPQALVATIIESAPHVERIWSFPGLPRNNYGFRLDEIDADGVVVSNKAKFDVVPSEIDGDLVRNDEQIQVDVTTGFVAETNTFTFDGTGGKPDYRGWEIVPSELNGRGILIRNVIDYSWDKTLGVFTLLQAADVFQSGAFYNIHFNPLKEPRGNSVSSLRDFGVNLITNTITLDVSYFGSKLIVEPMAGFITITLPPIATIVEGRPLMIEVSGTGLYCVQVVCPDATINWLRNNIYIMAGECLTLYKYVRSGVAEIRVCDAYGNFKTVGSIVSSDAIQSDVINMQLLDGSIVSSLTYARIYNEFVLHLPVSQVVSFDAWTVANNNRFFSLVNGSNQFHFPDRRNLYERANYIGKAGDYEDDTVGPHKHGGVPLRIGDTDRGTHNTSLFSIDNEGETSFNTGTETRPKSYLINKYILL